MNRLLVPILTLSCIMARPSSADWSLSDSDTFLLDLSNIPDTNLSWYYSDSPAFTIGLLSIQPGYASAVFVDSSLFALRFYFVRRAWEDSDAFDFQWFAHSGPTPAPAVRPDWPQDSDRLLELDAAGHWQAAAVLPPRGTKVIIVNHGWNDSPFANATADDDIQDLAGRIAAAVPDAKIYGWWWGDGPDTVSQSNPNGKPARVDFANLIQQAQSPHPPDPAALVAQWVFGDKTFHDEINIVWRNSVLHGSRLGKRMAQIGLVPRDYPIHMIGHGFGGVVSAAAADYLYNNSYGKIRQLTTLEIPALPWPYAIRAVNPDSAERLETIYYQWIPNIRSAGLGGPLLAASSNLMNLNLWPSYYPGILHSTSLEWYIDSAFSAAACDPADYGFNWSFASPIRPATLPVGFRDEDRINRGCINNGLSGSAIHAIDKGVDNEKEDFDSLASWAGAKATLAGQWRGGRFASYLVLDTTAVISTDPNHPAGEPSAGIGKRFRVPAEAENLSIDVRFRQVGPGDWLTVALDGTIVLALDAATEGVSAEFKTHSAAITEYAGKEATLRITLESNTPQPTIADMDNLRFTESTLAADINEDGRVNILDLIALLEYWMGPVYSPGDASARADITGDKKIDLEDLAELSGFWLWNKMTEPLQP
jgi:hypothetical protein